MNINKTIKNNHLENPLPQAVYNNHKFGDTALKCSEINCEFSINDADAACYKTNKDSIRDLFYNTLELKLAELKVTIVNEVASKISKDGLVPEHAQPLLEQLLNQTISMQHAYSCAGFDEKKIKQNIDELNQICPFTKKDFKNDFIAGKYIDKSKLVRPCSAEDFKSQPVENFLMNNVKSIKSFLNHLFFKEISLLDQVVVKRTTKGNIKVTLSIKENPLSIHLADGNACFQQVIISF